MFSKPNSTPPGNDRTDHAAPTDSGAIHKPSTQKLTSLIASDLILDGSITGGGELQVDGSIKGDVRVDRVTIGECGHIEGGVYAELVEVRGKVTGSITAKQVRLHGAAHVDGDISHEQLAIETGAFFQGRSLRLQRPPTPAAVIPPRAVPTTVSDAEPVQKTGAAA
jgi:cytoskeletal protein CcmA (bactofilin family)